MDDIMQKLDQAKDHHQIEIESTGLQGPCPSGESLLACAQRLGVELASECGGKGKCKACKIQVTMGAVSELTPSEHEVFSQQDLENNWRLACQTYPNSDCRLDVPLESMIAPQRTQVEGPDIDVAIDPPVRACVIELQAPSLSDPKADAVNLLQRINRTSNLGCKIIDIDVMRELSERLRAWNWRCRAHVRNQEVVAVSPPDTRQLGLAVDLGSTKIAGYLVDLTNGEPLASKGVMNPQISYGEDIITRINYTIKSSTGPGKMQEAAVGALNRLAADLCAEVSSKTEEIVEAVVVGNTAMHHLVLRLPVQQLVHSPYVPAVDSDLDIKARDIGLRIAPGAYVHILPNIAGFVGADHVAMLVATAGEWGQENVIALDIGTNTEISLIAKGRITSVSCASGPAFEGYHIKDGVRAARGAIEKIRITSDQIHYQTIGEAPPIGICGSGMLDAMAELYRSGVLDRNGKIKVGAHPRVRKNESQAEFVLISEEERKGKPAITLTQKDVREIQLGKAAIRAGIQILIEESGISEQKIDKIIIAGAFGSYIDVSSSVVIGMFPSLPLDRFRQVGNAAGIGAKLALLSTGKREEARRLRSQVKYFELASLPNFTKSFIQACYLGPYQSVPDHGNEETHGDRNP